MLRMELRHIQMLVVRDQFVSTVGSILVELEQYMVILTHGALNATNKEAPMKILGLHSRVLMQSLINGALVHYTPPCTP